VAVVAEALVGGQGAAAAGQGRVAMAGTAVARAVLPCSTAAPKRKLLPAARRRWSCHR